MTDYLTTGRSPFFDLPKSHQKSVLQQSATGEQRQHMDASRLNRLAASLLPVDKHQTKGNFPAFPLNGVNGLELCGAGLASPCEKPERFCLLVKRG